MKTWPFINSAAGNKRTQIHGVHQIMIHSQKARVFMPNGELIGTSSLSCEIVPKAISQYV